MDEEIKTDRRDFLKGVGCASCAGLAGGCAMFQDDLRYRFGGEVHRDFHASILDGYNYVRDNYGDEAIREVMGAFARGVHRSMHEKLKRGDSSELVEFWRYYLGREGGGFTLEETADGGAVLTVTGCPGRQHLHRRKIAGGEGLCAATKLFNEELAKDTPFEIITEITGEGTCRQVLRRKGGAI